MSAHAAVTAVAGWEKSLVEAWPSDADDVDGAWVVGAIDEDGNKYPVITVEADQYDAPGDSEKIARALIVLWAQAFAARPKQLEPVHGDQLPPIGSKVLIHLGSCASWVEHTVAGYYVWGDLSGDPVLHRVFVRVQDSAGYLNARLLKDVRPAASVSLEEGA